MWQSPRDAAATTGRVGFRLKCRPLAADQVALRIENFGTVFHHGGVVLRQSKGAKQLASSRAGPAGGPPNQGEPANASLLGPYRRSKVGNPEKTADKSRATVHVDSG